MENQSRKYGKTSVRKPRVRVCIVQTWSPDLQSGKADRLTLMGTMNSMSNNGAELPSGKLSHNRWENHHFLWENPLLMVIFNSFLLVHQRVPLLGNPLPPYPVSTGISPAVFHWTSRWIKAQVRHIPDIESIPCMVTIYPLVN